ncbi:MAG: hypothetical protein ACRBHB_21845 [Arenicella sp.]
MNIRLLLSTAILTLWLYAPVTLSAETDPAKRALPSIITLLMSCEIDDTSAARDAVENGMARFEATGETISSLTIIDGNTLNPASLIINAGVNSLVVLDGGKGPILLESIATLSDGQVLLGGGGQLQIEVGNDSQPLTFSAPCTKPQVKGHVEMVANSRLMNLIIDGQGQTSTVRLNGAGPFVLDGLLVTNTDTNQDLDVTLADGINTFDIAEMGLFASEYSGTVIISNSSFVTHSQPAFLSTDRDATLEVSNSRFESNSGISNGIELSSFADAVVDAQFTNSTFINTEITNTGGEAGAIGVIFAFDESELNVNFTDSTIQGLVNSAGVSIAATFDQSILNLDFLRTEIVGGQNGANGPGIDEISAQEDSQMFISFNDLSITGMTKDGIDYVGTYDNAKMNIDFDQVDILGGAGTGDEEGIDGFRSEDNSFLTISFVDSTVTGTDNDGIEDIESRNMSVLTIDFLRTEVGVNLLNPSEEDEGIEGISADDTANLFVNFKDSTVTGIRRSAIKYIDARGQSFVSVNMDTSSFSGTISAVVNLETEDTSGLCLAAIGNTFSSGPALQIPDLSLINNATSIFSVESLSNLSANNNNAIVTSSGVLSNAVDCPSTFTPPLQPL